MKYDDDYLARATCVLAVFICAIVKPQSQQVTREAQRDNGMGSDKREITNKHKHFPERECAVFEWASFVLFLLCQRIFWASALAFEIKIGAVFHQFPPLSAICSSNSVKDLIFDYSCGAAYHSNTS